MFHKIGVLKQFRKIQWRCSNVFTVNFEHIYNTFFYCFCYWLWTGNCFSWDGVMFKKRKSNAVIWLLQEMNDPFFDLCNHKEDIVLEFQKQPPVVFCKKSVPKNFANVTRKHFVLLSFNKVSGPSVFPVVLVCWK